MSPHPIVNCYESGESLLSFIAAEASTIPPPMMPAGPLYRSVAAPLPAHFLEFILMTFGRHIKQMVHEAWLVLDFLRIAPYGLSKKPLDVCLKLLPSLIRCFLIHGNNLLFSSAKMMDMRMTKQFSR
jgi:hypothetical protein